MVISRKGVPDGVRGGATVKKIALMKVRDMGRGRKGGAGAEADPLPQECRRGVKTTGIGSSLCLPALLGWACREMLLSPSRLGEERSAKGGALSCQAHGGCIHLAYATGQSVGDEAS